MQKFLAGLVAAIIGFAAVAQPALAASASPAQTFGFDCENGVCRLRLDLGVAADDLAPQGIWLEVMQNALRQAPDGYGFTLDDAITISMPSGELSLVDAELYAVVDDDGNITNLRGSALLPLPSFGAFGDVMLVTPTRVEFGYDLGANLTDLSAPMEPTRRYAYFRADAGLSVLTGSPSNVTVSALPGQHLAVVADLAQPMLWFAGQVTVRTDGQIAFLRELVEPVEGMPWLAENMPDVLPLRQTITYGMEGQVGRGVTPQLAIDATTQIDTGLAGTWLALDSVPLVAQGRAMLSPAGLLVAGSARTDMAREQFFGADVLAQVFVPFNTATEMTAEVAAGVHVPLMGINQVATGRISGDPEHVIAVTQGAWQNMQAEANTAGDAALGGFDWAAMQGEDGYRYIIEQASRGWALARSSWCGLAGNCAGDALFAEPVAAAQTGK